MDEARLTEIEHDYINLNLNEAISEEERAALARRVLESLLELIAEVRRLKEAVHGAYEGGYENGESSAEADITGIITDPAAGDDATAEQILHEIKCHLGLEEDDIPGPRLLAFIDLTREANDHG